MRAVTIRAATPADRDILAAQFADLNAFEDAIAGNRAIGPEAGAASLNHTARHVAETGGHMLVAELGGAVVGHLALCFPEFPPYVRPTLRRHGLVSELFVQPGARGTGIGTALLAEAERLTRARGLRHLMIGVLAGNDGAEALYRRAGFAPYAINMLKPLD